MAGSVKYVCPIAPREAPPRAAPNPSFPFCSPKCKLIDLGKWLDGAYRVAGDDEAEGQSSPAEASDGRAGMNGRAHPGHVGDDK